MIEIAEDYRYRFLDVLVGRLNAIFWFRFFGYWGNGIVGIGKFRFANGFPDKQFPDVVTQEYVESYDEECTELRIF